MPETGQPSAALAGGQGGAATPPMPDRSGYGQRHAGRPTSDGAIEIQGSAERCGGAAAGPWPDWARAQLLRAVEVARAVPPGESVAVALYLDWFNPVVGGLDLLRPTRVRPLAGIYRSAHAGSSTRITSGAVSLVDRHDVVGTDGWWRTWGSAWTPPRTRPGSVRLMFTPHQDRLGEFVRTATATLLPSPLPWTLACATSPRRVRRCAAAVLDLPDLGTVPDGLLDDLAPVLRPNVPPLCLPIRPGVALSCSGNGMTAATFGEQRCHLIALALRRSSRTADPLAAIAEVFAAHGIDAATPYRCG